MVAVTELSLGEVGAGARVETPGWETFTKLIFDRMHYGVDTNVAALALVLLAVLSGCTSSRHEPKGCEEASLDEQWEASVGTYPSPSTPVASQAAVTSPPARLPSSLTQLDSLSPEVVVPATLTASTSSDSAEGDILPVSYRDKSQPPTHERTASTPTVHSIEIGPSLPWCAW